MSTTDKPSTMSAAQAAVRIGIDRTDRDALTQVEIATLEAEIATLEAANTKLRKQYFALTMLFRRDILFSPAEFQIILRCLHPDNSASPECVRVRSTWCGRRKSS